MPKRTRQGPLLPGFEAEPAAPAIPPTQSAGFSDSQSTPPTQSAGFSDSQSTSPTQAAGFSPAPPPAPCSPLPAPESLAGQTVWIVDSHSLIHQVFHALPEMTSPGGQPVAAVFGFARDLLYLLETRQPDFLFCAFDLPGKTFRHGLYEQYKAGRPEMHVDLVPQIDSVRRLIEALGLPLLACPTFEADDVAATVARITEELGGRAMIVTADKDCRQLITEHVKLYNIRRNEIMDREALEREWGITPQQVVDYQALVGDATDNVPGVPLIGPKAARDLLTRYGTLENVLAHSDEIPGAARKANLAAHREQALLSRQLVRLDSHVPLVIDWRRARPEGGDPSPALALFAEFGFRKLPEKLTALWSGTAAQPAGAPPVAAKPTYRTVDTPAALQALLADLARREQISVDTETTHRWPRWAELVGMSFASNAVEGWYLPFRAPPGERTLDAAASLALLRPVLEDPAVRKIGQNLKYDRIVLRGAGVELAGTAFDTMVASYLLDAGQRNHNLDDLAKRYLNHATIKIEELIGAGKHQKRMDQVPVEQVTPYAGEDAVLPVRLQPILAGRLAQAGLEALFAEVEVPLIDVLVEMECNGIKVDVARLNELSGRFGQRMEAIQQEIYELAGHRFNIASPRQLQQVLFVEQKLPGVKQTDKSGLSTDAAVLEVLAAQGHPLPAKIVAYRQYAKLKGTYVDALPGMVHPQTGRVHASFNQVVAATGRLSSSDPNLQNIPVRTEEGREIRSAFVPGREGWLLLAADYSQIELRVLAHYTGDERLLAAFRRDEDIHARVASEVNGVPPEAVTSAMRRQAKVVNFGILYGQSATGLAQRLGIDRAAASQFIEAYFRQYPRIEEFLTAVLAECREKGYVSTILGRRRAIQGVRPNAGRTRNLAERTAVNTVIQGSAADLIKLAMIAIHRRLAREKLPARMLLQIHDELVFEVDGRHLPELARLVAEEMSGVYPLSVPLKVDLEAGPNWADTQPIDGRW
jgi:DNA polymerase-1